MKRLKFDNDTIRKVTKLVAYHDYRMEPTGANVRRAMHEIGWNSFHIIWQSGLQIQKRRVLMNAEESWKISFRSRTVSKCAGNKECVTLKIWQ